jgi:tetratricopeptide (TPR) repeat protein
MNGDIKTTPPARGGKRDYRKAALACAIAGTLVLGYLLSLMPGRDVSKPTVAAPTAAASPKLANFSSLAATPAQVERAASELLLEPAPAGDVKGLDPKTAEVNTILNQAREKIRAKLYDDAIRSLAQEREKIQQNPQSYVLMARALEGKKDFDTARDFYKAAIDKDPYLADAYFGFATTSEALGDLQAALGGMRNFLHVQPNADPQKLNIVQARSAIWEWESKLGRGPWGPTKGVPPDFTADQIKRDGRGVGIKMQIAGTKQENGTSKYEIKHSDKFQIFKP